MKRILISLVFLLSSIPNCCADNHTIYLSNSLMAASDSLRKIHHTAQMAVNSIINDACTFYRGCNESTDFGIFSQANLTLHPEYNQGIAIDPNRMVHQNVMNTSGDNQFSCWAESILDNSIENLKNSPNATLWQYIGWANGQTSFYPAFNWVTDFGCPNTYDPRTRPWYSVAASSPKNLVLVIDISNSSSNPQKRLDIEKEIAYQFLSRLGIWDFFGLVTYSTTSNMFRSTLLRATYTNIDLAKQFVDGISIKSIDTESNVGNAMEAINNLIISSIDIGETSACHNLVIWLSDGRNTLTTKNPSDELTKNDLNSHIFPILVSPDGKFITSVAKQLACKSNSTYLTISLEKNVGGVVDRIFSLIASGTIGITIRWSQPYMDYTINTTLITGGLPIYINNNQQIRTLIGVVGIDLLYDNITNNGQISDAEVIKFLFDNQVCEPLEIPYDILLNVTGEEVCVNDNNGVEKPEWEKLFPLWVTLSLLFVLCGAGIQLCIYLKNYSFEEGMCNVIIIIIFGVIAMGVGWGMVWPQYVKYKMWDSVDLTIVSQNDNPYKCCVITNCECSSVSGVPSCGNRLESRTDGICGNGYYCCAKHCSTCGCHTTCSRRLLRSENVSDSEYENFTLYGYNENYFNAITIHDSHYMTTMQNNYISSKGRSLYTPHHTTTCRTYCSTCCYCSSSVANRKCESNCGTCYSPVITFQYLNQHTESYIKTILQDSCSMNDYECVRRFYNKYGNVGSTINAYYNTNNPSQIGFSTKVELSGIVVTIIFSCLTVIAIISFCLYGCNCHKYVFRNREQTTMAEATRY